MSEYNLDIKINPKSTLDAEIVKLEKLVNLSNKLKVGFQEVNKSDPKAVAATIQEHEKLTESIKKQQTVVKKSKQLTDDEVRAKIKLQEQNKLQRQSIKDLLILENQEAGTLQQLAARNRQLARERDSVNLKTKQGRDRVKAINLELDKNNKKILENSDKLKAQKQNVGNYTSSVKDGIQASGLFGREIAILTRIQATMNAILKKNTVDKEANTAATVQNATATNASTAANTKAVASISGVSKVLKILRVALISTGIGAIVVALGSLIAAFSSTQRGADIFARALRPIQVGFELFVGFLQDKAFKAFDALSDAIDNPKQALEDLGGFVIDNITNRFTGLIDLFVSGKDILSNAFEILGSRVKIALADVPLIGKSIDVAAEEQKIKEATKNISDDMEDLANAGLQVVTGFEDVATSLKNAASETVNFVSEATRQANLLQDLIEEFERLQIATTVPLAKANLEYQKLREIAQDQTKTDKERIEALSQAEEQQRTIVGLTNDLLNLQIKRLELEQSFNDTSREEQLELQKLYAQRLEAEAAGQKKINGLVSLRTGLEKKILASRESIEKIETRSLDNTNQRQQQIDAELKQEGELLNKKAEIAAQEVEIERQKQEEIEGVRKAATKEAIDSANELLSGLAQANVEKGQEKIEAIEKESKAQEDELSKQESRAERGLDNTLELEQKKAAELEVQRQEEAKKQERRLKVQTYYNLVAGYSKTDPKTALFKAAKDIAISEAISAAFAEKGGIAGEVSDTVSVGADGQLSRTHGSGYDQLTVLDKREGILNVSQMQNLGGKEGFYNLQKMLNNPISDDIMFPKVPMFIPTQQQGNKRLERKMDELIGVIKSKPVSSSKLDHLGNVINERVEDGVKHTLTVMSKRPKFRR